MMHRSTACFVEVAAHVHPLLEAADWEHERDMHLHLANKAYRCQELIAEIKMQDEYIRQLDDHVNTLYYLKFNCERTSGFRDLFNEILADGDLLDAFLKLWKRGALSAMQVNPGNPVHRFYHLCQTSAGIDPQALLGIMKAFRYRAHFYGEDICDDDLDATYQDSQQIENETLGSLLKQIIPQLEQQGIHVIR